MKKDKKHKQANRPVYYLFAPDEPNKQQTYKKFSKKLRSTRYLHLLIAASTLILLTLGIITFGMLQKKQSVYYAIAGITNFDAKIFLAFSAIVLSCFVSASSSLYAYFIKKHLQLLNVTSTTALALSVYLIGLSLWFVFSVVPCFKLESGMQKTLEHGYQGEYDWGSFSVSWNYVQVYHSTCGVLGSLDWEKSDWSKNVDSAYPVYCCEKLERDSIADSLLKCQVTSEDVEQMKQTCARNSEAWPSTIYIEPEITKSAVSMWSLVPPDTVAPKTHTPKIHTPKTHTPKTYTTKTQAPKTVARKTHTRKFTGTTWYPTTSAIELPPDQQRHTVFKAPIAVGTTNRIKDSFIQTIQWQDRMGTINATYYIPRRVALEWYEAQEYCSYYIHYHYPNSTYDRVYPGLAVGFSTEELVQLATLERLNWQVFERAHLGFYWNSEPHRRTDRMSVFGSSDIEFYSETYYEAWDYGQPSMAADQLVGCLEWRRGRKHDCNSEGIRPFICAKYSSLSDLPEFEEAVEGIYYQYYLNENFLGEYWPIQKQRSFDDARKSCKISFGEEVDIAAGFYDIDLLISIAAEVKFTGSYIHLGFWRNTQESNFKMLFNHLEVPTGRMWANGYPKKVNGKLKPYGALCKDQMSRCNQALESSPFACAHYSKTPTWPLSFKVDTRKRKSNTKRPEFVEYPRLGYGFKSSAAKIPGVFSDVFDWRDAFGSVEARYFVPEKPHLLPWDEANNFCIANVPIDKTSPLGFDSGEREYDTTHLAGLAVGFTTSEAFMLSYLFDPQVKVPLHLGFYGDNTHISEPMDPDFKIPQYGVIVSPGEKQEWLNSSSTYDDWCPGEPALRGGIVISACLNRRSKCRRECVSGDPKYTFICVNYTYFQQPQNPQNIPKLSGWPGVMYMRFVNPHMLGQYWPVNKILSNYEAWQHCENVFGPGYGLPIGFDKAELEFLSEKSLESELKTDVQHLGISRLGHKQHKQFFLSKKFMLLFGTFWAKRQPNGPIGARYGCLGADMSHVAREDCAYEKKRYVCALYSRTPISNYTAYAKYRDASYLEQVEKLNEIEPGVNGTGNASASQMLAAGTSSSLNTKGSLSVVRKQLLTFIVPSTFLLIAAFILLCLILSCSLSLVLDESPFNR